MKENPVKFVWSMESTSCVSVGVSSAGWNVKSSSKLLASDGLFCERGNKIALRIPLYMSSLHAVYL